MTGTLTHAARLEHLKDLRAAAAKRRRAPARPRGKRRCLVVGGGDVGLEKVEGLLACDGDVKLIAPDAIEPLQELAREGSIRWERREYAGAADLDGVFMVIAATSDTDVNIAVYEDAERRAMLVNVVDVPPLCNFILPAIIRSGPLAIAISTAGASPALAKRIRDEIADEYGEPYARLAVMLNDVRGWAKGTLPTYQDRKVFFESIVNGEPDPVELLPRGDAPKGDVIGTARIAGIQAAKRTAELVPLCHPLPLSYVDVAVDLGETAVVLTAEARTSAQTGVEMEAMTAAAVAALTVYDMVKGLERDVSIEAVELVAKSGGRSGDWRRD